MVQLPNLSPSAATLTLLAGYQTDVDLEVTFVAKSLRAQVEFKRRNTLTNVAFKDVKSVLTDMCFGARRCSYCEDSMADEVEHIFPKKIYPSKCFDWNNYVYACGTCNGPKNSKFAIFRSDNGLFEDVSPKKNQPLVQPVNGRPVIINPRIEDAMDFWILDLNATFKFVQMPGLSNDDKKRADYTFNDVLRLNDQREMLRVARANAYGNYDSRLYKYDAEKAAGATTAQLDILIKGIQTEGHPTVFKEIQRFRRNGWLAGRDAKLDAIMARNPEVLTW